MRRPLTLLFSLASCFALLSVAACGSSPSSGTGLISPQPGGLASPTNAHSFLWLPRSVQLESNGDYLVTDAGNWDRTGGKVVLFSHSGKPLWVYTGGLDFPHAAYPLKNGNIIIADTGNDRVIEVNPKGKIVWNTDDLGGGKGYLGNGKLSNGAHLLYPNDAFPMTNGNILISSRFSNTVYEITKTGKVVWSCGKFMNRQHNPRLLPNGDLIVADSDDARGIVINHGCNKILFQYGPNQPVGSPVLWPRSFQMDGNNYVIGDSLGARVLELNAQKQIVDHWNNLPGPFYVTVLPDGNLLTQDSNIHGAVELMPGGKIQPIIHTTDPTTYPSAVVNPGFETGVPQGWKQGDLLTESLPAGQRADMKFDTSSPHSGKSSGMISWPTDTPHLSLFWFQTVSVKPGHTYEFTGYMRTDKVEPCQGCDQGFGTQNTGDANFSAAFLDPTSTLNPSQSSEPLGSMTGTQPWTQEVQSFFVPTGVTEVEIECTLTGRGTAWFDDVSLKDLG